MPDINQVNKENSQCNHYTAHLYLAENDNGKEYFFVKDIHWIVKYKEEKKEEIAQHGIPIKTKFSRVPSSMNHLNGEKMLECLKEQRDFWQSQLNKKIADHINNSQDSSVSFEERKVNTKSGFRYKERLNACEHFIEKLEQFLEARQ